MKNFLITSLNISWRVLVALFIGVAVSMYTGLLLAPVVLGIVVLGFLFTIRKKDGSLAFATMQADLFNPTQLQIKSIVMNAIYAHYGWKKVDGRWTDQMKDGRGISTA